MAMKALSEYGITKYRMKFVIYAGNIIFQVFDLSNTANKTDLTLFEPNQYLLRIHDKREQNTNAIKLEMEWLFAMRQKSQLQVPEPIRALNGNLVVQLSHPGLPEIRDCTMLRWLKGRRLISNIRPYHYQAQGRIMAQLHNFAQTWKVPKGLSKRKFDYNGLFKDSAGANIPNSDVWLLLPNKLQQPYKVVAQRNKKLMTKLGKGPKVYGLIHGDCGVDANVLFSNKEARIIDFDGSGFGYYLYDLALALEHCWDEKEYPKFIEALLKGYTEHRNLPEDHLKQIDILRAGFYVYMGLWTIAIDQTHPNSPNKEARHTKWLDYGLRFINKVLDKY
ncbi:phosphotransferase enzyme family protein [Candidatus Zixiibacteriota bacterium]